MAIPAWRKRKIYDPVASVYTGGCFPEAPEIFKTDLKVLSKLIYFEVSSALSRCLGLMSIRSL